MHSPLSMNIFHDVRFHFSQNLWIKSIDHGNKWGNVVSVNYYKLNIIYFDNVDLSNGILSQWHNVYIYRNNRDIQFSNKCARTLHFIPLPQHITLILHSKRNHDDHICNDYYQTCLVLQYFATSQSVVLVSAQQTHTIRIYIHLKKKKWCPFSVCNVTIFPFIFKCDFNLPPMELNATL